MRYFRIYSDERNLTPRFLNWNSVIKPGRRQEGEIYEALGRHTYLKVELNRECEFMDVLCYPCFMVSKEFADLIRLYCPTMGFKHMFLFDEANKRTVAYQIPKLLELDCLDKGSELSRDKSEIKKGILRKEKIEEQVLFRIGQVGGVYVVGNLEFVESAYRREVMGMKVEEYIVQ